MTPTDQRRFEQQTLAYKLKIEGLSGKEIGEKLGVSRQRVSQILIREKWRLENPQWTEGLSTRASNILHNLNITSKDQAIEAFYSGKLHPSRKCGIRNYGWGTHKELAAWLGFPEPVS